MKMMACSLRGGFPKISPRAQFAQKLSSNPVKMRPYCKFLDG